MWLFRRRGDAADALRRARTAEMELEEARQRVSELTVALETARAAGDHDSSEAARRFFNSLADGISEPLAFLAVQVFLVGQGTGDDLTVADLASTGESLLEALARQGVSAGSMPGTEATFDPDFHVAVEGTINTGSAVRILVPDVRTKDGRVARRAFVEPI